MSDYLSNLVAKSRNAAAVAQPRPASLFETSPRGSMHLENRDDPGVLTEDVLSAEIPVDRPPATSRLVGHAADTRPTILSAQPSDSVLSSSLVPHSTTPAPNRTTITDATVVPAAGSIGGFGHHSSPDQPASPTRGAEPLPAVRVFTEKQALSMIAPSGDNVPPAPVREAGPTIKISIGRVDVRAIMPTASAPRPASPRRANPLSLDDYLKHDGERKR